MSELVVLMFNVTSRETLQDENTESMTVRVLGFIDNSVPKISRQALDAVLAQLH